MLIHITRGGVYRDHRNNPCGVRAKLRRGQVLDLPEEVSEHLIMQGRARPATGERLSPSSGVRPGPPETVLGAPQEVGQDSPPADQPDLPEQDRLDAEAHERARDLQLSIERPSDPVQPETSRPKRKRRRAKTSGD